jgi:cell division protein FtsI/penicillin-binding protein 2
VAREGGTAHQAILEKWQVFGKTGTANVAKKDGPGYEENKWISSFIAGAPVDNPRVCVLVIIREPDRSLGLGYTGGAVAAPAVKEILDQTLAYLEVESDNPTAKKPEDGTR